MKKVKIINGTYGHRPEGAKFITPIKAGEVVEVSDMEAARLAGIGIAVCIVETAPEAIIPPVATPPVSEDGGGQGETPPEGDEGAEGDDGGILPASAETLDIVDGHFTVESLMEMTRDNMEKLAADLSVDVSKCKNKPDIAAALAAVEVKPGEPEEDDELEGDGEAPPDLGAAPPVV